jgi:hypothetical protein
MGLRSFSSRRGLICACLAVMASGAFAQAPAWKYNRLSFREGVFRGYCKPTGVAVRVGHVFISDSSRTRLLQSRSDQPHRIAQQIDLTRAFGRGGLWGLAYVKQPDRFVALLPPSDANDARIAVFRLRTVSGRDDAASQTFEVEPHTSGVIELAGISHTPGEAAPVLAIDSAGQVLSVLEPAKSRISGFRLPPGVWQQVSSTRVMRLEAGQTIEAPPAVACMAQRAAAFYAVAGGAPQQLIRFTPGQPQLGTLGTLPREFKAAGIAVTDTLFLIVGADAKNGEACVAAVPSLTFSPMTSTP